MSFRSLLHDPRNILPCPLSVYVRDLDTGLRLAAKGNCGAILIALRRAEDASADTLTRVEDGAERDALVHFASMVGALRGHVLTFMEREMKVRYAALKAEEVLAAEDEVEGEEEVQ